MRQRVENGREAVLDLAMPVMNGLDAAPLLRKVVPDARIILEGVVVHK